MTILSNARTNSILAAAAVVLGAVFLLQPTLATAQSAPASQATSPAANPAPPTAAPATAVETRIKSLHDQLKITAAEAPQWNAFAQTMRDDAKTTGALIVDRERKAKTMTAPEDLHAYQAIAQAHAQGLAELSKSFDALYAVMSDAQKKNADRVFSRRPQRPVRAKAG